LLGLSNTIIRSRYHDQRTRQKKDRKEETHEDPDGRRQPRRPRREQGISSITPSPIIKRR
jgi:hypothetical protein